MPGVKRFVAGGPTGKILKTEDADGPRGMVAGDSWAHGDISGAVVNTCLTLTAVQLNCFNGVVLALQTFGGENEIFEGTSISERDCFRLLNPWWM
jgi:hypothetical protein